MTILKKIKLKKLYKNISQYIIYATNSFKIYYNQIEIKNIVLSLFYKTITYSRIFSFCVYIEQKKQACQQFLFFLQLKNT